MMKRGLNLFLFIVFFCMIIFPVHAAHAGGMKYLSPDEFGKYDKLLKEKGYPELKTIVAVYDDSFDPPRTGLKCVNKKKQVFQVYIEGDKIKKINKTSDKIR